jgi:hypothetical protein
MALTLPSIMELQELPKWACVAYAARCAMRVQPLFNLPITHPERDTLLHAVDRAIALAAAGSPCTIAHSAADVACSGKRLNSSTPREIRAAYAAARTAIAATNAASSAIECTGYHADAAANAAADARYVANTAAHAAGDSDAFKRAIAEDLELLRKLSQRSPNFFRNPVNADILGPLGALWPDGPPAWYVVKRAKLDTELARITATQQATPAAILDEEQGDTDRLVIRLSIGEFAPLDEVATELVKLYKALNEAHIAGGGQGLVVDDWKQYVEHCSPVAGGCS